MYPNIIDFFKGHTAIWEKGKVNHPKDPGGVTNDGVATHFITELAQSKSGRAFLESINITPRFILGYMNKQAKEKTEIFDPELLLSFTPEQCRKILIFAFWERTKLNTVPCTLTAYATFDFCVNSGDSRGKKFMQVSLNDLSKGKEPLVEDGLIGPKTIARCKDFVGVADDLELAITVCNRRERFLRNLSTFSTFGKGWMNRINGLRDYLKEIAENA